ncbi:hypothetical protein [Pseudomonas sp. FME51]|uniref:hypothetical protein n=1 Tax=Pseudomonas sp. FME51 TaxID=2742609 RepID=UPI001868867E|nr:hypothetical protein [Pseudomonas sp. FME51]
MVFTTARISETTEIVFLRSSREFRIRYQKSHRATGGRTYEVVLEHQALCELIREIHRLEALPDAPLEAISSD